MRPSVVRRVSAAAHECEPRRITARLLRDDAHYDQLIARELPSARVAVWIGTANLKELRVEAPIGTRARARGRYVSVLDSFETLANQGVELKILHGRPPSRCFQAELASRPELERRLELRECPRVHLKTIVIDARLVYLGSANFTGAGLGARSSDRRNFELGIVTDDDFILDSVQARFDAIWSGRECGSCKLRTLCPGPLDTPRPKRRARSATASGPRKAR
jgi:phosphatidylserine/phosphatidylglycerophosphate/cardiolipin synthase-like enzyme